MKKKIGIALGIIILLISLFGFQVWKNIEKKNVTLDITTLKKEKISETVLTPGTLKLANEQTVYYAPEKGKIAEFLVTEGADVTIGTPLLRYENKQLDLEKKQTELQLQSSKLQLSSLLTQKKDLNAQLENDKENKMLQTELEQVKLQEKQANLEIEQVQLQKQSVEQQIADLIVKSELDGKVLSLYQDTALSKGGMETQPLMQIGTLDQLIVEGAISEYDTLKIQVGQAVMLRSDTKPEESWQGKVSFIAYLPKEVSALEGDVGVQYPIKVAVEDTSIPLKPGFQMIMEVVLDERTANTLPLTSVKQEKDKDYVYTVVDGKAKKQKVKVGHAADETIEILEGLNEKDIVIVDPPKNIKNGMDVKKK